MLSLAVSIYVSWSGGDKVDWVCTGESNSGKNLFRGGAVGVSKSYGTVLTNKNGFEREK
jgi:hypothetical protein